MAVVSTPTAIDRQVVRRRRPFAKLVAIVVVMSVALVFAVFPIYWVVVASLDPTNSLSTQQFIPRQVSLANYRSLLSDPSNPFGVWWVNSLKVAISTSLLSVCITTLAAFALSRFKFRGRTTVSRAIILAEIFPHLLTIVAIFLMVEQIGSYLPFLGLNSHGGLIFVSLASVLGANVWLMKGFFDSIPIDLDESAVVDGASHWQVFWHIILPLARPMIAVVAILVFIWTYGDVIRARVLLQDTQQLTLAVGLWTFIGGWYTDRWGLFAAGALMAAPPVLVVFYALQDWIVGGLTRGAVKT